MGLSKAACKTLSFVTIIYILLCLIGHGSGTVQATHFRGGTISWKPSDSFSLTYKEIIFTFKLGWRLSRISCDEKTITSGTLVGEDARWFCMYGCDGVVASTREKCTEFNTGDDWMYGSNTFKYVFKDDGPIEISYMECCWLTDLVVGAGGEWALTTTMNLGIRSDTGGPNSSPVTAMAPMITLRAGVADVIDLAVRDYDGDKVTCRLGRHVGECGAICNLYSDFTLDSENCLLRYNPSSNTTGKVPIALMVEDFHNSAGGITMGKKSFATNDPLSSVPIQFLIILKVPPKDCSEKPLIEASIPTRIPVTVRVGKNFTFTVASAPCDIASSIEEFVLIAPIGVRKSQVVESDGIYVTEINWTPTSDQDGSNLICVTARSSDSVLSDQVCITVEVPKATDFCTVVGGSHFITFDKSRYNFNGMCEYLLVGTSAKPAAGLLPFNVTFSNDGTLARPSDARTTVIDIEALGGKITVKNVGGKNQIYVNEVDTNLPVRTSDGLRIENNGKGVSITLSFGIQIFIDDAKVSVQLSRGYRGNVHGLCGNYNGEAEDDFMLRGQPALALDEVEFTNSYIVNDRNGGCKTRLGKLKDTETCGSDDLQKAHAKCSILTKTDGGCFAKCHDVMDPKNFFETCKKLVCKAKNDFKILDMVVSSYADICQRAEVTVCNWRREMRIVMECAPNSHYENCAKTIQATCADSEISPVPSKSCIEGCVCNEGYILSGSVCVPTSECGCTINNSYHRKGFTYRPDNCTTQCVCGEGCKDVAPCNAGREDCQKGPDGFYRCLERMKNSATCKAVTDPHYQTFDGTKFDSMGSCAYIMVRSKRSATNLTAFTVVAVNEKLADNASHVKEVHVEFGNGHTLVLKQQKRAFLNDKEIIPGSTIYGVDIRIGGRYLVVDFYFGLVIRWDGFDMLRITAWSPLRHVVEGLCGDWDGDPSNDFVGSLTMEVLPDSGSFTKSWRVEGYGTDGCQDYSDPESLDPPCSNDAELAKYQTECKPLTDAEGPFRTCHEHEDPTTTYNACIYDLCATGGDKNIKERIFSSYADDCREHGIVQQWRDEATSVECVNGIYSECVAQCQPTCSDPTGTDCRERTPNQLGSTCVAGCVCNEGFLLSGTTCVPAGDCGCIYNGRYMQKGFSFAIGDCTQTCTCIGPGELQCGDTPGGCTKNRESCKQREDGYFQCVERPRKRATCKAVTDPHYMTFDGKKFDSMGTCNYIMVRNKADSDAPDFRIVTVNEQPWPNRTVSHVKEAWIHVGTNLTIGMQRGGIITINGQVTEPGTKTSDVEIKKVGRFWIANFNFGLYVKWDGEDRIRISAWAVLKGKVEGICGDFDDDESNDFMTQEGVLVESISDFVNSWKVAGYNNNACLDPLSDEPETLCSSSEEHATVQQICSTLAEPDSPYKDCIGVVNSESYINDCIFDMCAYGNLTFKERIFSLFVEECRQSNVTIVDDWRKLENLQAFDCDANSHYVNCSDGCEETCTDRDASICRSGATFKDECAEGCVCDVGYVKSGTKCVPESECGCVHEDGTYMQQGFAYRTRNCSLECRCGTHGKIDCVEVDGCPKGLRCRWDTDGYKRCIRHVRRRATCKAITDPHYTTFDGVYYDSMGTCAYIMTRSIEGLEGPSFRVVAVNEKPNINQSVSHVKEIYVHVGENFTLSFHQGPVVRINGEVVNPGSTVDGVKIRKVGRFTVAEFPFRVIIRWDGVDRLRVMAYAEWKGSLEGLCGDFNDEPSNDFKLPDGRLETNITKFVDSWRVDGYDTPDCVTPVISRDHFCTSDEHLAEAQKNCSVLIDPNGPLASCLGLVDPQASYNSCVFDVCANPDPLLWERVISSYTVDCREEAADDLPPGEAAPVEAAPGELGFRNAELEAALCQDGNARFASCIDPCQPTCSDRNGSECKANSNSDASACVDACQCNEGFILSGNECIREEDCGCVVDGRYIAKGFTYNNRNCSTQCTCFGKGEVQCRETGGCEKGFRCRINTEGKRACIPHVRRRATCKAVTDPHYMTFDGNRFDSMGTCAYLMVRSRDGANVSQSFRVITVNEQRDPNYPVSHVREVHVRVGNDFNLVFLPDSVVRINNEIVLPGSRVGPAQIKHVGKFVIAEFDFGLVVKWDGVDRVRIMAWAVLKGQVEGICGDFNDDPENDFVTPSGRVERNIDEFVSSWKVNSLSPASCRDVTTLPPGEFNDYCNATEVRAEVIRNCSVITDPEGIYKACHKEVAPETAFENCLFDVCNTQDADYIERNALSYAEDCLEQLNTPPPNDVPCEENTTNIVDGVSHCQPTCDDPDASKCLASSTLANQLASGCVCIEGFLRSGSKCVTRNECGCLIDGKYREIGFKYLNSQCDTLCECRGPNDIVCNATEPCQPTQQCTAVDQQYKCTRRPRNQATCKVVTDPHYTTFDGKTFDASAWCGYTLARNILTSDAPQFEVIATNERDTVQRSSSRVTTVRVKVGDDVLVEIKRGKRVRINGVQYNAGSTVEGITIRQIGHFIVLEFPFDLVLRWDNKDRLRLTVSNQLKGKVEGLCGTYNDNVDDDFTMKNGAVTSDVTDFVKSWHTGEHSLPKCRHIQAEVETGCLDPQVRLAYSEQCDDLTDPNGAFVNCHQVIDPKPAFDACLADMCNMDGDQDMRNRIFSSYVHDCLELSEQPEPWRAQLAMSCPENSRYMRCMPQCQPTCSDPTASLCKKKVPFLLGANCVEGCRCIAGYRMSHDKCVKIENCGCLVNGVYHIKGFKFRSNDCRQECICRGENVFVCKNISDGCLDTQRCGVAPGGYWQCMPKPRQRAVCKAITDPHYTTFDGVTFDSQGVCSYTMVRAKQDAPIDPFSIVAVNEQPKRNVRVSHVREIHTNFRGQTLSFYEGPIAMLNGEEINTGTRQSGMHLEKSGRFLSAHFDFGLEIKWDGADRLRIIAKGNNLRNRIEGVCGNFNDDPSDDLTHQISGEVVTDSEDFVNSWRVLGFNDTCITPQADFLSESPPFVCGPEERKLAEDACQVLINPTGVLSGCRRLADSLTIFENCVLDMCALTGDVTIHDRVISDFTEDCRSEGGQLPDTWREDANLTEVSCPDHSHFAVCMDECQPTCWDLDGYECKANKELSEASCVEGCQADEGYVLSGDEYVPVKECGCFKDGKYFKNEETFYTEECETRCTCKAGVVTCHKTTCDRNEECMIGGNGRRGCIRIEKSVCQVWGSTHFTSFDNRTFEVTSDCHFTVAKRGFERGLPSSRDTAFFVQASVWDDEVHDGVVAARNVRVRFPNLGLMILLRPDGQAKIGGKIYRNWRWSDPNRLVTLDKRGTYAVVQSFFGLKVSYDGNHLHIELPNKFIGKTGGMCGNFNGNPEDDFFLDDDVENHDLDKFASNHAPGCKSASGLPPVTCSDANITKWSAYDKCGAMMDPNSEFAECSQILDAEKYFDRCVNDVCRANGSDLVVAQALKMYAYDCATVDAPVCNWRKDLMLQIACPVNSHYVGCAEACEETCGVADVAECRHQAVEDCVCDEGYMRSNGACIAKSACTGCIVDRKVVPKGFTYRSDGCRKVCTCLGNGAVSCEGSDGCITRARCGNDERGFQQCLIKPRNVAGCQVFGNGHFITFDGSRFNTTATCLLTMARTKPDTNIPSFLIQVDMQSSSNPSLSRAAEVIIKVEHDHIIMAQGKRVMVNGREVVFGSVFDNFAVRKVGQDAAVVFKFGLVLKWDGKHNLRIEAGKSLAGQMEGLCGNFDEDEKNDFKTPQDIVESDMSVFINSWKNVATDDGCRLQSTPKDPCTRLEGLEDFRSKCEASYSREVLSFARCNLLEYCLFEMCATGGDMTHIESTIYTFYETCNREYVETITNVTIPYPEVNCTGHSQYNRCMQPCQRTCSDQDANECLADGNLEGECVPGCQCDDGYVLDGETCVVKEDCGCVGSKGEYYANGFNAFLEDCERKCACNDGVLTCQDVGCVPEQFCGVRNGAYGCHWEDECKDSNGGCDHDCSYVNNTVTCTCREGFNLTDDGKTCQVSTDCAGDKKDLEKWKSNTMQHWISKLDAYMGALKAGAESGSPAHVCKTVWTDWFDVDDPDGTGDMETLENIQREYPEAVCVIPVAIEAQLHDGRNSFSTGLIFRTMSSSEGLKCFHSDQKNGELCGDFRVRFLCLEELI